MVNEWEFPQVKKKRPYQFGTMEEKPITYNSGMINRKMEGVPLFIWNNLIKRKKSLFVYYQDDIRLDIVNIKRYNIILKIP